MVDISTDAKNIRRIGTILGYAFQTNSYYKIISMEMKKLLNEYMKSFAISKNELPSDSKLNHFCKAAERLCVTYKIKVIDDNGEIKDIKISKVKTKPDGKSTSDTKLKTINYTTKIFDPSGLSKRSVSSASVNPSVTSTYSSETPKSVSSKTRSTSANSSSVSSDGSTIPNVTGSKSVTSTITSSVSSDGSSTGAPGATGSVASIPGPPSVASSTVTSTTTSSTTPSTLDPTTASFIPSTSTLLKPNDSRIFMGGSLEEPKLRYPTGLDAVIALPLFLLDMLLHICKQKYKPVELNGIVANVLKHDKSLFVYHNKLDLLVYVCLDK